MLKGIKKDKLRQEKILQALAGGRRLKSSAIASAMGVATKSISPTLTLMKYTGKIDREDGFHGHWFAVAASTPRISRRHPVPPPSRTQYTNDPEIEKGIPVPVVGEGGLTALLRRMEVSDSVVLPHSRRGAVATAASHAGMKIVTRRLDADMMRVWRVK